LGRPQGGGGIGQHDPPGRAISVRQHGADQGRALGRAGRLNLTHRDRAQAELGGLPLPRFVFVAANDPDLGGCGQAHFVHSVAASTLTPSSRRTSALPDLLDTARFPCLTTGMPVPATTRAAAVLMLKVPLSSPPVPQVSSTGPLTGTSRTICSRKTSAAAAISSAFSPFIRKAVRNAAARAGSTRPATRSRIASVV